MLPSPLSQSLQKGLRGILAMALLSVAGAVSFGAEEAALRDAARVVGSDNTSVLQLLRELSYWKNRAVSAESAAQAAGVHLPSESGSSNRSTVLGVLEADRTLILSGGRLSGAVLGALVTTENGIIAKVVESRDSVSAALVDQTFKGDLSKLEGAPVRLLVNRPEQAGK